MNLNKAKFYINRELSWLKFNDRVLEEAENSSHPLLERLKFISIFSSNLDEFFMIRVAGVKEQIHAGLDYSAADGLEPEELLWRISIHVHLAVSKQAEILEKDILPKMRKKGIRLRTLQGIRGYQKEYVETFFKEKVYPLLTPLAIDLAHPFPQIKNLGLNLLVELREPYQQKSKMGVIHIPSNLPRFIPLPSENGASDFILMEDLIQRFASLLFPNMKILSIYPFRVTRNADLDLSEAEADDLLKLIERELRKRRLGTVIRLEVGKDMAKHAREFLMEQMNLQEDDLYVVKSYLDLSAFSFFLKLNFPDLKDPKYHPTLNTQIVKSGNIFKAIREQDILLHHPYESFNHVSEFIQKAANDPKVLAIKQTLYRTSGKSPIVKALKGAVVNGKQVTALIELKARFDEQNNIEWARELDRAGVNVVYGFLGLKTHCKISMVVRKEEDTIRRYLHLSTGNYNETTARIYTDMGLLTCDKEMGMDASGLFNLLTGYSLQKTWNKFLVAPATLRTQLIKLIHDAVSSHRTKDPSYIAMVVNSIVDPDIIRELYKASAKGVKIDLVVRGICCLVPGIPDVSDNIHVRSIVGRFLEHTRVFYFKSSGQTKVYLGSADLMERNLNRRVELVFPILDPKNKHRIIEVLEYMLKDNVQARILMPDGSYQPATPMKGEEAFSVQEYLLQISRIKKKEVDTIEVKELSVE